MTKSDAYALLAELHKSGNEDALAILESELARPRIDPPAPVPPTPEGPLDKVDWHKLFQTIGTAFITLVVIPVLAYYGYNLPSNVADARTNSAAALVSADAAAQHAKQSTVEAAAARTEAQAATATATKAVSGVADSLANVASKVDETKRAADAAKLSADAAAKPKPLMPLNLPKE